MHTLSLRAGLAAAFTLWGGLAYAAPPPTLDKDPAGFLRYVEFSPSPQARAARREIADGPAALTRERALAQKEGIAVVPAQLNRPLPPDDRNAAPLYVRLDALRHAKPLYVKAGLPLYAQSLSAQHVYTAEQIRRVRQAIDARQDVFALLHQAADRPQCVFARDWAQDPLNAPFLQYAGLRESARELRAESVLLAEEGRYPEAITNQARGFRLAEHAASDPTLISYLVAEAMDAIAASGMQDILALAGPNADVDAQVGQALTEKSARLSLRQALSGEAALGDAGVSLLRRGPAALGGLVGDAPDPPRPAAAAFTPSERRFYSDLLDAAEADYLHQMRSAIRLADTPDEVAAFARASREAQTPTTNLVQEVARRLSPLQFDTLNDLPARRAAFRAITRAAAAVLAERARTGAYPETLPGAFPDPYNPGRPLGYRREGADGFVVYSAGPGGRYDGGRPGDKAPYDKARNRFRYPVVPIPVPPEELK